MISQQVGLADIGHAVDGMRSGDGLRWIVRPGS
jgi:hypothetical protein